LLGYAAARTAAGNAGQVNALFFGQAFSYGGSPFSIGLGLGLGCGFFLRRGLSFRWGRGCFGRSSFPFFYNTQDLADFYVFAFLPFNAGQDACLFGAYLYVHFVGFQFYEHVAHGNGVAFLLKPLTYGGLYN
jgi:hypothetical protein